MRGGGKPPGDAQIGTNLLNLALRQFDRAMVNLLQPAEDELSSRRMSSGGLEEITCHLYESAVGPTAGVIRRFS